MLSRDPADLRALLVGRDEVFLILGFHGILLRVRRGDFFAGVRRQGYYTSVEGVVGSTVRGEGGGIFCQKYCFYY